METRRITGAGLSEALRKFLEITGDPSLSRYLARHGQTLAERVAWAHTTDNEEAAYLLGHADALAGAVVDSPDPPGFAPLEPIGALTTMDCITRPFSIPIEAQTEGVVEPRLRDRPSIVPVRVHEDNEDDDLDELIHLASREARTLQRPIAERPTASEWSRAELPEDTLVPTVSTPRPPDAPTTARRLPRWSAATLAALAAATLAILALR